MGLRRSAAWSGMAAALSLAVILGVTVAWPVAFVAWRLLMGAAHDPAGAARAAVPDPTLLVKTLGVAALVAAGATALGWPAAWAGRNLPPWVLALLVLPLLLPSYLISSGWGLLRAPG